MVLNAGTATIVHRERRDPQREIWASKLHYSKESFHHVHAAFLHS